MLENSVRKTIVPHGFHKLTVAFSSISPSQYGYFDVGCSSQVTSILHDAQLTTELLLPSVL